MGSLPYKWRTQYVYIHMYYDLATTRGFLLTLGDHALHLDSLPFAGYRQTAATPVYQNHYFKESIAPLLCHPSNRCELYLSSRARFRVEDVVGVTGETEMSPPNKSDHHDESHLHKRAHLNEFLIVVNQLEPMIVPPIEP